MLLTVNTTARRGLRPVRTGKLKILNLWRALVANVQQRFDELSSQHKLDPRLASNLSDEPLYGDSFGIIRNRQVLQSPSVAKLPSCKAMLFGHSVS